MEQLQVLKIYDYDVTGVRIAALDSTTYAYVHVLSLSLWYIQIEDAAQPADIAMKNLLYSVLSVEGSYKSRKVCSHIRNMFDLTYICDPLSENPAHPAFY